MGGGLESRCVGRVYGADGVVRRHLPYRTKVRISPYFIKNPLLRDLSYSSKLYRLGQPLIHLLKHTDPD